MTATLRACLSYWPLTILGLLGTGALVFWSSYPTPVYFSQTDVIFLAPVSRQNPNSMATSSDSIISMAGIIQREIDQARVDARTSSAKVTLVDQGIYDGTRVKVPDEGGQWKHWYKRPVLDVQVTGSDPSEVSRRAVAAQQQILDLLDKRQVRAGVAQRNFIRAEMVPATPSVYIRSGRRIQAMGASGLLGASLTLAMCATASKLHYIARHRASQNRTLETADPALVGTRSEGAALAAPNRV
jgi:hypothetical protein